MEGEVCTTCGAPMTEGHSHDAPAEGGGETPVESQDAPAQAENVPAAEKKPWWKFW